ANLEARITDLPGAQLGWAEGLSITLDATAAGRGWFVDSTPGEHSEFGVSQENFRNAAEADSQASERVDLLTVLLHEIGHVLGLEDHGGPAIMAAIMTTGQRVLLGDAASYTRGGAAPVTGA